MKTVKNANTRMTIARLALAALLTTAIVGCSGSGSESAQAAPAAQTQTTTTTATTTSTTVELNQASTVNAGLVESFPGRYYGEITVGVTKSNRWELTVGTDILVLTFSSTDQEVQAQDQDGNIMMADYGVSENGLVIVLDTTGDGNPETEVILNSIIQDGQYNVTFSSPGNGRSDEILTAL